MGDLTKNISRHELVCHCGCGFDSMDVETIDVVQGCCDYFAKELGCDKVTLIITSASRCVRHNRSVGSNDTSEHPKSRAIDMKIVGVNPVLVYGYIDTKYADRYGVGLYPTFVHLDTRTDGPARW